MLSQSKHYYLQSKQKLNKFTKIRFNDLDNANNCDAIRHKIITNCNDTTAVTDTLLAFLWEIPT